MAAINFVKGEQYYTAEFQIKGPVNIHIERAEAGALYFRQRSIDHGSYDLINGANWNNRGDLTIDTAIQGVVYPMWIKIESASEPTLAEMVEGEQSGGGAGTAESTMEYLDVSGGGMAAQASMLYAYLWKAIVAENVGIFPIGVIISTTPSAANSVSQIAIDFSTEVNKSAGGTEIMTIKEAIMSLYSVTEEELAAIPRITKEQFYSLEA